MGTHWSIAGMVASQCGIPLITGAGQGNSMFPVQDFLPQAFCLGDFLKDEGYTLYSYGGERKEFAGKVNFYKSHGFDVILGKDELEPLIPHVKNQSPWGIHDDDLINLVQKKTISLIEKSEPFGLFLSTLDTHDQGYRSASCKTTPETKKSNTLLEVIKCTDILISDFIRSIQDADTQKETVIVLLSDHLYMLPDKVPGIYTKDRKNLFAILDPQNSQSRTIETNGSPLDISTTLLPFLNYSGEIGFGRDLLDNSLSNQEEIHEIQKSLPSFKSEILSLWDFPEIEKGFQINGPEKLLTTDGRSYPLPLFITFDDSSKSVLNFAFPRRQSSSQDSRFIEIKSCNEKSYCIDSGYDNQIISTHIIDKNEKKVFFINDLFE